MIDQPTLYPHQEQQKDRARGVLGKHRRAILTAPPGTGKTRMSKWILGAALNRTPSPRQSGNLLFSVQRRGLVDNAVNSFAEAPSLPHGIIMSQRDTAPHERLQVASIDTLLSWYCEGGAYRSTYTFDLVVYDEAHSHLSKLRTFLECHDVQREALGLHPAYVLGLTATPQCKGLGDVFREIVPGPRIQWLIDHGYLSPFRYFGATQGQLDRLKMKGGEFTRDSVSDAMDGLAGDLVRDWKSHAAGRPTVGFFPRLSHAQEARDQLRAAGVLAEYVDGSTPDDERRRLYRALADRSIDYLCNVGIIERGTDIPCVACVQLCTAVGSVVRYKQMIGRGSRPASGKADCLVLDHGGNIARHGLFEDEINWILDNSRDATKDHKTRPTIQCPRCPAIYRGGRCSNCGYEPTKKERLAQGLDFDGRELKEITRETLKKPKAQTCEQLMISALYSAGMTDRTWKQAIGIAKRNAEKQGTTFRVPRRVTVAGQSYEMLPFGSPDAGRRVRHLFPFTVGDYPNVPSAE